MDFSNVRHISNVINQLIEQPSDFNSQEEAKHDIAAQTVAPQRCNVYIIRFHCIKKLLLYNHMCLQWFNTISYTLNYYLMIFETVPYCQMRVTVFNE